MRFIESYLVPVAYRNATATCGGRQPIEVDVVVWRNPFFSSSLRTPHYFDMQEICFYNIPTEKESKAGAKPELLKSFPSGHEELVTKILLLDVDKV